ncbi:hypothetical protein [Massilia sp. TWR1-2-2]|uniref:hypothetical protein n=1 Tax=Massilia sp. TWR1-2-2 TaxID=2804584 RepID=UPI003CFAA68D
MQAQSANSYNYPRIANDAHESRSGVSWGAVFAGAAAAAALSLVLFILGTGLGLASISPWSYNSAAAIGISTILYISFTQLAASAVGGYMAGRLRTKWASIHSDEVYFRDTAHGLLAWAVATLLTAMLVGGAVRAAMSGAIDAGAGVARATAAAGAGVAAGAANEAFDSLNPTDYFSDMLLRSDKAPVDAAAGRSEVVRIFATALQAGSLPADDRACLARVVAARTGLPQADADKRVDDVYAKVSTTAANAKTKAKEAADTARKASAGAALWMTVAMLLGAFVAAMAATFGGKMRGDGAAPAAMRRR